DVVAEQDRFDGRFFTVKLPNPENAEALTMAIDLAQKEDADLVVATDPDCDRMGAAVRTKTGKMKLLTGKQIGSLIAYYRTKTLFDRGMVNKENASGEVIMFCEVAAYTKSRSQTVDELLDDIFAIFGYFAEKNGSLVFEGAEGASKIKQLVESYARHPFSEVLGSKVTSVRNFETETIRDVEGDEIPKEKM